MMPKDDETPPPPMDSTLEEDAMLRDPLVRETRSGRTNEPCNYKESFPELHCADNCMTGKSGMSRDYKSARMKE